MEKMLPAIPAKRYFTIGEVSDLCGVKPYVLRYWEQEFTQLKPMKRRGNRRYYQHHEVLLIRRIRELLYDQGFTISGARNRLNDAPLMAGDVAGPGEQGSWVELDEGDAGDAEDAGNSAEPADGVRASAGGPRAAKVVPAEPGGTAGLANGHAGKAATKPGTPATGTKPRLKLKDLATASKGEPSVAPADEPLNGGAGVGNAATDHAVPVAWGRRASDRAEIAEPPTGTLPADQTPLSTAQLRAALLSIRSLLRP
jgi:hypothetical protein